MSTKSNLPGLVRRYEKEIFKDWMKEQLADFSLRADLISETELRGQSAQFLETFREALEADGPASIKGRSWDELRTSLEEISKSRARLGFSPSETATFVFSLKQPLFALVQKEYESDPKVLSAELWTINLLIDKLGIFTMECFHKGREEVIKRQQDEMLELSTPVVKIWDQILALPLIGTLDSARTQVVMESLLQEIVQTSSMVAIIDITGVPMVDTLVAQHLIKTVSAARLMGAECIISGIRPQIAQTMVHLGVTFSDIATKATLADAIRSAFAAVGCRVVRREK
ncbi:MAG: STAS domain-containing protein [Deltaproteobacteria bacterium]|nr:STAS domain-containing protein [Deltaproteobacteria bacterium]